MHEDWHFEANRYADRHYPADRSVRLYHFHTSGNWLISLSGESLTVELVPILPLQAQVLLTLPPTEAGKLMIDKLIREGY